MNRKKKEEKVFHGKNIQMWQKQKCFFIETIFLKKKNLWCSFEKFVMHDNG